jgi:hypothetical protein
VLVQPEMESWRSPLASISPFSAGQLRGHRPMQWRLVQQAAAETATGFKKEKAHTPMGKWRTAPGFNFRMSRHSEV